jgi:hypothetical protein
MIKANDCAFPTSTYMDQDGDMTRGEGGLTKLEYFAGLAMQGFCASSGSKISDPSHFKVFAIVSVGMTQALIAELDKQP